MTSVNAENYLDVGRLRKWFARAGEEGRRLLQINFVGDHKLVPMFRIGIAINTDAVDMGFAADACRTIAIPEADAPKLARITVSEQRESGALEQLPFREIANTLRMPDRGGAGLAGG